MGCDTSQDSDDAPPITGSEMASVSTEDSNEELVESAEDLSDADIRYAIVRRLILEPIFTKEPIQVSVKDGIAQLSGTTQTLAGKDRAKDIAKTTKGVRGLVDRLEVPASDVPNAELTARVENALLIDSATEAYELDVQADEGKVILKGEVDSWAERQLATEVASQVSGVTEVENQVDLDPPPIRPSPEIERDIRARLQNDVMVDAALIDVTVKDGVAVLDGVVGSAAERSRALSKAWVDGVLRVNVEDLEVQWWQRDRFEQHSQDIPSEAELRDRVMTALRFDPRIDSDGIEALVKTTRVTLTGAVTSLRQRTLAEQTARETLDVRSVHNALRVVPNVDLADEELAERVTRGLKMNALVDDFRGEVRANDGHVVLDGMVDTPTQKTAALNAARSVLGVKSVNDEVEVYIEQIDDLDLRADIRSHLDWNVFVDPKKVDVSVDRGMVTLSGEVDDLRAYRQAGMVARAMGAEVVYNRLTIGDGTG